MQKIRQKEQSNKMYHFKIYKCKWNKRIYYLDYSIKKGILIEK